MVKLTANFYDADTGEYIEIRNGKVVTRHQSILSNAERRRMKAERSELITNREEPYIAPQISWGEEPKHEIILQKPKQPPLVNHVEEPYVAPKIEW